MARSSFRRLVAKVAVGALAVVTPVALMPVAASADTPTDLFISEYIEGSSNNKALEIYNGTGAAVDLSAYSVFMSFNGGTSTSTIALTGSVASGDVHVLAASAASATILAVADQQTAASLYNGDDAVVLRKGTTVVDAIGQVGFDPGTEWGTGLVSTADNTLRRQPDVCAGDPDESNAFDPSLEWDGFATDTFGGLGAHTASCSSEPPAEVAPTVTSVTPTNGGKAFPTTSPSVTFSEPVNLAAGAISLSCSDAPVTAQVTGGPTTFTIDPDADLAEGAGCTLTVDRDLVTDQDSDDPPDAMAADFSSTFTVVPECTSTPIEIGRIQGSTDTSPVAGQTCVVSGVVVGDYEGAAPNLRGFYVQDAGDGTPATSDGIFVFNGGNQNLVSLGDRVTVTGTAGENQGQTQISTSASNINVTGTGTVAPTEISLPTASLTAYERYEGMLVTYPQTLYVTEHFQLGRFGQVVVSSGGRLQQPTNVVAPGALANALQAQNTLNRLIIDDTLNIQNPDPIIWGRDDDDLSASNTLRGGDTTTGATGVMTYTWAGNSASGNAYRLRPLDQSGDGIRFEAANPRPEGPAELSGDVTVASMNLLNYFNTFDGLPDNVDTCRNGVGGALTDCRGADTQAEFDRQWPKTVAAITKVDADVLGVNEIENDGYGADSAIAHLVDRLNDALGAGTYAYIDVDAATGQPNALGTDAIKVGMLYKPDAVTPVGNTAALNTEAFVNGGDGAPRSRPSLAQAFEVNETGGVFVADVNHLKSKGSACDTPDAGDGQGNCNEVRTNAAMELRDWLDSDPTGTGDTDVLILGDLNSYALEDPITVLKNAGYTNLVSTYLGPDAYSYVFDGQWGYLDHALGSADLVGKGQVNGVAEYHINADEPSVLDYNTDFKSANLQNVLYNDDEFRVSDHDPVIVGLTPNSPATVEASFDDTLVPCGDDTASLTVEFADRDADDTHDVTIAWGDGSSETVESASSPLTRTHTYAAAGRYTATVTVTDSHGHVTTTTADVAVEFTTQGVTAPFQDGTFTARRGSTVPVKVELFDCDGSEPTDLEPTVSVTSGNTIVRTGTMAYVNGTWLYELSTKGLAVGTYTVTVTVPETGQTITASLRVRA